MGPHLYFDPLIIIKKTIVSGEQILPTAVNTRGRIRRARDPGHRGALPRLRHARLEEHVLRDRHQR